MGRSVSTHRHAIATVYLDTPYDHEDEDGFRFFLEDLAEVLKDKYPSLDDCDRWQDREDHVILENRRAEVSVSEYCGLVAVCLAPLDDYNPLDHGWCDRIASGFRRLLVEAYKGKALTPLGRFSNGEQVFSRVA